MVGLPVAYFLQHNAQRGARSVPVETTAPGEQTGRKPLRLPLHEGSSAICYPFVARSG